MYFKYLFPDNSCLGRVPDKPRLFETTVEPAVRDHRLPTLIRQCTRWWRADFGLEG